MAYRRPAQLAVQAALLLALKPQGSVSRVREIAATLGVPATYLAKILHKLTRSGLLRAVRGPGGGVQLARAPRETYLWDVLSAIEPVDELGRCFLGLEGCNALQPCPLHKFWAPIRTQILNLLQTKSLDEFAAEAESNGVLCWKSSHSDGNRLCGPGGERKP
ncbi:MAG: RrF2 family transcriptional regulator [Terriglobia bacterium]